MTAHKKGVLAIAFSPEGRFILTGGLDKGKPPFVFPIKLWEVASGKQIAMLGDHSGEVTTATFSPDGTMAFSGDRQGSLKLWDLTTKKEIRSFSGEQGEIRTGGFSSKGDLLLTGGGGKLKLWDPATGNEVGPVVPRRLLLEPGGSEAGKTDETPVKKRRVPRGRRARP